MSSEKCIIPDCLNNIGVPFPENDEEKRKWLELLCLEAAASNSFVCLDHFHDEDIETVGEQSLEPGVVIRTLRKDAFPAQRTVILNDQPEENNEVKSDSEEQLDTSCRLCLGSENVNHSIFDKIQLNFNSSILIAMQLCLQPLKVLASDPFPKRICDCCLEHLRSSYQFKIMCLASDDKRRKAWEEQAKLKRKVDSSEDEELLDSTQLQEKLNELKFQRRKRLKSNVLSGLPTDLKITKITAKRQIDVKFDRVEEELRKVLEGQLTEEQQDAENIIIAVTSDDEEHQKQSQQEIKYSPRKHDDILVATTDKICDSLAEGNIYHSKIGHFYFTVKKYVFGFQFYLVDGYLFELRLEKGQLRYFRCVCTTCESIGRQVRVDRYFDKQIEVQTSHNHKVPSLGEITKQMFFYVIRKRMQADNSLNFRHIYEEVCKHDPRIRELVPIRNVINEMCKTQLTCKSPKIVSFEHFYNNIEDDLFQSLHFTFRGKQFYQERFQSDDGLSKAVVFANLDVVNSLSLSNLMYVDSSFKIDTSDSFDYQLVTVLVWRDESYYPIMFSLINGKTQEIYKKIFEYLHDVLAPNLRPEEIVTDYEANVYYALGETYLGSHIGGSVFYFTQNLYKKVCSLNLSRELETNSYFRNIYHMLLMLPLLPVNTILDGFNNIETQAKELNLTELTKELFEHVKTQWIDQVTPDLFCVHRLENRINENVVAPFKKLRDYLMLSNGKHQKISPNIVLLVKKLIELDAFLTHTFKTPSKRTFIRDLSSTQKKNVLKAWQFIENHPKININNFFTKVLGYIKCMENQLWIWGFYRYSGEGKDDLINAANFSIVSQENELSSEVEFEGEPAQEELVLVEEQDKVEGEQEVMDAVIDENGEFVIKDTGETEPVYDSTFLKYVYKET